MDLRWGVHEGVHVGRKRKERNDFTIQKFQN